MIPFLPVYIDSAELAHMLIRLCVAFFFLYLGTRTMTTRRGIVMSFFLAEKFPLAMHLPWIIGLSSFFIGIFYVFGLVTLTISIFSLIIIVTIMKMQDEVEVFPYTDKFFYLLIVMIFSLILTGPGLWALNSGLF
jgi:uncharacterized membrane protein YphA (DoxX/SURF4 family)